MKNPFVAILSVLVLPVVASANDSSIAEIKVNTIQSAVEQLPKDAGASLLSFEGPAAQSFMKLLPGVLIAADPASTRRHAETHRSLMISGNAKGSKTPAQIIFNCRNADEQINDRTGETTYKRITPRCSINYYEGELTREGDSYEFDPFAIAKKILGIK